MKNTVNHNGVEYAPGRFAEIEDEAARRLIRLKAAVFADKKTEEIDNSALQEMIAELCRIDKVEDELALRLIKAGFETIQSVAEAVSEDLIAIKGIGRKTVVIIQESAEELLETVPEGNED